VTLQALRYKVAKQANQIFEPMKKIHITCLLLLGLVFQTNAQVFYASKDFEKKGQTEYLMMYGGMWFYWTNIHTKQIELNASNHSSNSCQVSFPHSKAKYTLIQGKRMLTCQHPNGRKQVFQALPYVYVSRDFERKGVKEFLQFSDDHKSVWYYTSLNKQKKIKLIRLDEILYNGRVRFPGQTKVYKLRSEMKCFGGVVCTHPDGRKQRFSIYGWND
jgi:hypothetical protein